MKNYAHYRMKTYAEIQREKAVKRLKKRLVAVGVTLVVLILLGIAGAVAR